MKNPLRSLWQSRAPRERLLVGMLAAFLGAMLYVAFVQTASRARAQLDKSVSRLRDDALRVNMSADEVLRLRALPQAMRPVSATDLRVLAQAKVDSAGLGGSLRSIEPLDGGQVRVTFGAVPFVDWLAWVDALRAQQARLDTTRIEALAAPGMVSVTATFTRPGP